MRGRLSRDEAWRLIGFFLLVAALLLRSGPLALLGAGLAIAALSVELWARFALRCVVYRRVLGEQRAFYGEEIDLTVEIDNRKPLPLPWLEAGDSLPDALEIVDRAVAVERGTGRAILHQLVSLRWYERVRLRYRVRCLARGAFTLGPVRLASGDPFGFAVQEGQTAVFDSLLVYPKVLPLEAIGLPARHPFGRARDPRRMFEDATRVAGVRPYVAGDSPRHIHWKASARLGELQTRLYDPTTSHTVMLYLNLASFKGFWWAALNREQLELSIVATASVASWAIEQGYHVGLATNGAVAGGQDELGLVPAGDDAQRVRLLELLARVSRFARTPLEQLLARDRTRLPWGTTVVVVSAVATSEVLEGLQALRRAGHVAVLLEIGGPAIGHWPGIVAYRLPEGLPWPSLPALSLTGGTAGATGTTAGLGAAA